MFSSVINLEDKNNDEIIELLYEIFKNDFIDNRTYLAEEIYIDPISNDIEPSVNKEKIFWHIITRVHQKSKKREFDKERAIRIKWIKSIILNYADTQIKLFYNYEKNNKIRLYLWAYNVDFVVIIQKLGKRSSYLVTSFYIDKNYNRNIYQKRYESYINKNDKRLLNCEWF